MKNIVYIGQYNGIIGGIERYMQKSAEILRRNGFAVQCLYMEEGGRDQHIFSAAFDRIQHFSPESGFLKMADLIILHNIIDVKYLQILPRNKTYFFAHDHNIYCQRHHYYMPIGRINCHRTHNKWICRLCSLGRNPAPPLAEYRKFPALVLSEFIRGNLCKNGFEHVVKLPAFITCSEQEHIFLPDHELRILFLGQLIRGKGADLMLKTLAKLDIPFRCTIAGEGKDRRILESMVEKYGLQSKVFFTGFVSDPAELWSNSDVLFFPIRWQEPFGLVGLEALAHGVPVISFDLGGVREYLSDVCGALIPEKNIKQATETLTQFYRQPELLKTMGQNGLTLVKNQFSEKQFVEKFKELIGGLQ